MREGFEEVPLRAEDKRNAALNTKGQIRMPTSVLRAINFTGTQSRCQLYYNPDTQEAACVLIEDHTRGHYVSRHLSSKNKTIEPKPIFFSLIPIFDKYQLAFTPGTVEFTYMEREQTFYIPLGGHIKNIKRPMKEAKAITSG